MGHTSMWISGWYKVVSDLPLIYWGSGTNQASVIDITVTLQLLQFLSITEACCLCMVFVNLLIINIFGAFSGPFYCEEWQSGVLLQIISTCLHWGNPLNAFPTPPPLTFRVKTRFLCYSCVAEQLTWRLLYWGISSLIAYILAINKRPP